MRMPGRARAHAPPICGVLRHTRPSSRFTCEGVPRRMRGRMASGRWGIPGLLSRRTCQHGDGAPVRRVGPGWAAGCWLFVRALCRRLILLCASCAVHARALSLICAPPRHPCCSPPALASRSVALHYDNRGSLMTRVLAAACTAVSGGVATATAFAAGNIN